MDITLVTGGARSGKSSFAEELIMDKGKKVCYIATAIVYDGDMKDRIKKHIDRRPKEWATIEQYKDFDLLINNGDFNSCDSVLLDCITIMITNIMFEEEIDFDNCSNEIIDSIENKVFKEMKKLLKVIKENEKNIIFVTNEVGMGLVPSYRLGSIFRDIAGRVNQFLAQESNNVYLTVSGIPVKIK